MNHCQSWEADGFVAAGIMFFGTFGVGKTGLMAAVANGLAQQGMRVLWINFARLWRAQRATYEKDPDKRPEVPEWKLMQEIQDAQVLFLDDVNWAQDGESDQMATPAAVRFFTDIVRVRHDFGKPYFLTTNHLSQASFQNEWKARACTVIFQDCHCVVMGGPVLRPRSHEWNE
jgi:DNA replication protein DnaC